MTHDNDIAEDGIITALAQTRKDLRDERKRVSELEARLSVLRETLFGVAGEAQGLLSGLCDERVGDYPEESAAVLQATLRRIGNTAATALARDSRSVPQASAGTPEKRGRGRPPEPPEQLSLDAATRDLQRDAH